MQHGRRRHIGADAHAFVTRQDGFLAKSIQSAPVTAAAITSRETVSPTLRTSEETRRLEEDAVVDEFWSDGSAEDCAVGRPSAATVALPSWARSPERKSRFDRTTQGERPPPSHGTSEVENRRTRSTAAHSTREQTEQQMGLLAHPAGEGPGISLVNARPDGGDACRDEGAKGCLTRSDVKNARTDSRGPSDPAPFPVRVGSAPGLRDTQTRCGGHRVAATSGVPFDRRELPFLGRKRAGPFLSELHPSGPDAESHRMPVIGSSDSSGGSAVLKAEPADNDLCHNLTELLTEPKLNLGSAPVRLPPPAPPLPSAAGVAHRSMEGSAHELAALLRPEGKVSSGHSVSPRSHIPPSANYSGLRRERDSQQQQNLLVLALLPTTLPSRTTSATAPRVPPNGTADALTTALVLGRAFLDT